MRPQDNFVARFVALERKVAALMSRGAPVPSPTRPDAQAVGAGTQWWDPATLRPSWSDGTIWRDANGNPV